MSDQRTTKTCGGEIFEKEILDFQQIIA